MTMTIPFSGRSQDDPAWDSQEVRRELNPIVRRLRVLLEDLERVVDTEDEEGHDDD
jgi:hypothetical protein